MKGSNEKNCKNSLSTNGENSMTVLIKFSVSGMLRYLSHAETLRVFQRACIRARIELQFSQGFNPRPKLSLPLPRTVGLETQDDLLTLKIHTPEQGLFEVSDFFEMTKNSLAEQLPEGIKVVGIEELNSKKPIQPEQATYIIQLLTGFSVTDINNRIGEILSSETLNVVRKNAQSRNVKTINVRNFIKSINLKNDMLNIDFLITNTGSIRLDEIMSLLEIDQNKIKGPVRRTNIFWPQNNNQESLN